MLSPKESTVGIDPSNEERVFVETLRTSKEPSCSTVVDSIPTQSDAGWTDYFLPGAADVGSSGQECFGYRRLSSFFTSG